MKNFLNNSKKNLHCNVQTSTSINLFLLIIIICTEKIVDFLMGFNKTYEGTWNAKSRFNKFEESSGDMRFSLRLIFPNAEHETILIPTFVIYDGKYIENLYIMKLQNHIFRKSTNAFFNIDMENKSLNASFNSFIVYRSLYDKTENLSMKLLIKYRV